MTKNKIGTIMVIVFAAVTVLLSVPAFAQGPERVAGNPLLGVFPHTIPGGMSGPAAWDNGNNRTTDVLVGAMLGGFLVYMIENNQNRDQDRYYTDRDRDRQTDRYRDHRYYDPNNRRYEDRRSTRNDRDYRYDTTPWNRDNNRYPQRYPR